MKVKKAIVFASIAILLLAGCADKSSSIKATYVSPIMYEKYSCDQLGQEVTRISQRVAVISGQQDKKATNDAVATTAGVIIFWPALFFLAAGEDQKVEIGQLKGQYNAIRNVAIQKHCSWAASMPMQQ
jgi:uncharacterized lipoprotein NlpE involved in copper resistance